jgi:acetate kinase
MSQGSHVLVVNAGSSSLKYQLIDPASDRTLARGLVERLGSPDADLRHWPGTGDELRIDCPGTDPAQALGLMLDAFADHGPPLEDLRAIGHRVVHGGPRFTSATLIDTGVIDAIRALVALAPLHNPVNLDGIETMRKLRPDLPQVAVFDTSFHAGLPAASKTYPLPVDVAERWQIRRYGFHGTSVAYVTTAAATFLGRDVADLGMIVCHLGNGASVTAVDGGRSTDTSMGFSPLEGLMMGSRVGDLDASVPLYLQREAGLSVEEVDHLLNRESGMLGMAGATDMRTVESAAAAGDANASLALDIYAYRLRKYIGAYYAVLPHTDVLVFTGGVGENAAQVRADVCATLSHLGIRLDAAANSAAVRSSEPHRIDDGSAPVAVLVVPTNEELQIARETVRLLDTLARPTTDPKDAQ